MSRPAVQEIAPETQAENGGLPEGWAGCRMGDVANVVGGGTPKASDDTNFSGNGHAWITPADLSGFDSIYIEKGRRDLSDKGLRSSSAKLMPAGTVLMSSRAPIGYVAIAANDICTNQGFKSFVCHEGILPEYVYYWLKYMRPVIEGMGSGSTFTEISGSRCKEIPFEFPPFAEQERIVAQVEALLARVNAARERLTKVPAILKRFRQSVLAAACSGQLTADWRNEDPAIETGEELINKITDLRTQALKIVSGKRRSKLPPPEVLDSISCGIGNIPDGWICVRFGSVISELRNGISTKPNVDPPGTPILRISAVRPGSVVMNDFRYLQESNDLVDVYCLRDSDLLFTRYNGSVDLLGVCGMVRDLGNKTVLYPDKLMRIRFDHNCILPSYAEIFFQGPTARDRVTAKSKSSAGQQGVSGKDIKDQPFVIPPVAEQQEIVHRVEALFALADRIELRAKVATERVEKTTQSILARAFRGELVGSEAELARREGRGFESAAQLLARIQVERERSVLTQPKRKSRKRNSDK